MALEKWKFDTAHSAIGFSVRHLMIAKVHGLFKQWSGSLEVDEEAPSSSRVHVEIDAASVDTREPQRDDHLRSSDFLDVDQYPKIIFDSTEVDKLRDDIYRITGYLTIRGTTREVVLDAQFFGKQKDPWGGERAGFEARATIDRKNFGLMFNVPLEGGGFLVGDRVDISLDIEVVKETAMTA